MTSEISREEFLAHIGYLRAGVDGLQGAVAGVQASVDKVGDRTTATELEIALLKAAAAAAATGQARRRTSADAVVVAVLGTALAGLVEWVKAHAGIK
jgi:hypothetical protein